MTGESLDPRVAELLSALLDGAVSDEERATAEAWLERSAAARAEYRSLAEVKAALGGMGEVEPPFGFFDRMVRQGTPTPVITSAVDTAAARRPARRWSAGPVIASLVASAAAFVVIGGGAAADRTIVPPLDDVADGTADGVTALRSGDTPIRALRQEADGVEWDEMPEGLRLDDDGAEIWKDLTTEGGEERVVVFRDGVVVTVAAEDLEAEVLVEEALALVEDEPSESFLDRARNAVEGLLDSLSLD